MQDGPILLVLDDVWSEWESLIQKFNFGIDKYKILVTSRFVFRRFDHTYKLNILNHKDAMTLFCHSALRKDDSSKIPEELLNEVEYKHWLDVANEHIGSHSSNKIIS